MHKNQQRGAISMLTVIFLALLLTIITTSFVRLSITEQRQSIDDDLSTRAFYAAESGVEDAKRAIAEFQDGQPVNLNGSECTPADNVPNGTLSTDLDTEYTCQLIDMSPANYQQDLAAWEAVTIPLSGSGNVNTVEIKWHFTTGNYNLRNNAQLLNVGTWTAPPGHPAMLRAAFFSHAAASFTPAEIRQNLFTSFLNPTNGSGSASIAVSNGQILSADCQPYSPSPSDAYACTMRMTGLNPSRTNYLRLQSLYVGTNIQVTLLDSSNNPVLLDNIQAVIDVTGRAGDVYRRVEARVSLLPDDYPLPDIALWSNTDICKAFRVTDDPAEYDTTACPSWQP